MNNDYEALNKAVMKVTGPRSSFSWTKAYFTAPCAVTPVGQRKLGLTLAISSYTEIQSSAAQNAAATDLHLRHHLKICHVDSICLHTTFSTVLAKYYPKTSGYAS